MYVVMSDIMYEVMHDVMSDVLCNDIRFRVVRERAGSRNAGKVKIDRAALKPSPVLTAHANSTTLVISLRIFVNMPASSQ